MKLTPARIAFDADGVPSAPDFGDVYHARAGAAAQARHVFLAGNGLPARWQGRGRFVVLETGFGLGNNFLETWAAWRDDPARCGRLHVVSIEKHPPRREDLARALAASPHAALAAELVAAWPPLASGLHRLAFDGGAVVLDLLFDDIASGLKQLTLQADAVYLDGFAPARNPAMWDRHVLKGLRRLMAPGGTAATWSIAREVRDGLVAAGFELERRPGFAGKRDMLSARHVPRGPQYNDGRPPRLAAPGDAVIVVGAGLAGAACAEALARAGCRVTVLERAAAPAQAASGNPGGLFHGIVNAQDGLHARAHRAAALLAERRYAPLLRGGAVPGQLEGLLRLAADTTGGAPAMQALLDALGLPPDYVQALDAEEAARRAGLPLASPAWWFPGGGWLAPAALVAHSLSAPGVTLRTGVAVERLDACADGRWAVQDARGDTVAEAGTVVLCNAGDAPRLLDAPGWPIGRQRGQLSIVPHDRPGLPRPRVPVAGGGYALTLADGRVLCGATAQAGDVDASVRAADHAENLARLQRLTGWPADIDAALEGLVEGRTAFRVITDDRLPAIGAVPQPGARHEQPRRIARMPGLFVCTALGSRGITWAPLAGELIASLATGAPLPLEAALADALDPARFAARAARRALSALPSAAEQGMPPRP